MDLTGRGLSGYEQGFIKGYIEGFSEEVAKKFENLIAEKLSSKTEELLNTSSVEDIKKFMKKVSDSFYYCWDVLSKDDLKSIVNSDKSE